jgi:uncharacterized membrane protein
MNDQTFLILFRLLHIGFGIVWTGGVLYIVFFIMPAVKKSGLEGTRFWLQLNRTGYPLFITMAALISIISGFMLLWKLSNHFERIWFMTLYAKIMCAGIITSIIAFIIDIIVIRTTTIRLNRLGTAIVNSGQPHNSEQLQELKTLQKRVFSATLLIAVLLIITIISMSIFRWVS